MNMESLTPEQKEAVDAVMALASSLAATTNLKVVETKSETYADLRVGSVQIFLYDDGEANIHLAAGGDKKAFDRVYELADFNNVEHLRKELLADLGRLLK